MALVKKLIVAFFIVSLVWGCSTRGRQTVTPATFQKQQETRQTISEAITTIIIGFTIGFSLGVFIGNGK